MVDSVLKKLNLDENSVLVNKIVDEIELKGNKAIFNVTSVNDTLSEYDVSVTSFKKLHDAKAHLKKTFIKIGNSWAEEKGFNTLEELIKSSNIDLRHSLEDTTAYLNIEDNYFIVYISVKERVA